MQTKRCSWWEANASVPVYPPNKPKLLLLVLLLLEYTVVYSTEQCSLIYVWEKQKISQAVKFKKKIK